MIFKLKRRLESCVKPFSLISKKHHWPCLKRCRRDLQMPSLTSRSTVWAQSTRNLLAITAAEEVGVPVTPLGILPRTNGKSSELAEGTHILRSAANSSVDDMVEEVREVVGITRIKTRTQLQEVKCHVTYPQLPPPIPALKLEPTTRMRVQQLPHNPVAVDSMDAASDLGVSIDWNPQRQKSLGCWGVKKICQQ